MDLLTHLIVTFIRNIDRLFLILCIVIALGVLERLSPAERDQTWRGRFRNLGFISTFQIVGGATFSLLVFFATLPSAVASDVIERTWYHSAFVILFYIFVGDFFFYWYHRAQHAFPSLWAIHELHHSDAELNATSSLRTYFLELPIQALLISFPAPYVASLIPTLHPLQVAGSDTVPLVITSFFWLFFTHANIRLQLGPLTPLATGPQLHRTHHSVETKHQEKNFAQFFPVFDILFGTYVRPEPGEFPKTGTPHMASDIPFFRALVKPFKTWFRYWH